MTKAIRLGIALIALHVLDDSFIQANPGTSVGDHLVSGVVPLAVLALAAWVLPRLRGVWQGALSLSLGLLGIAAGVEAFANPRLSGDDLTGVLALLAGAGLLGLGAAAVWRHRGSLARRAAFVVGAFVVVELLVFPVGVGYVFSHVSRERVPAPRLGAAHENVAFKTSDGLALRGWYVPSRNGAAVIAFPGRKGPQRQARMLIRHGYGVLLFDRRGEGASDGDPNAFGWGGAKDVDAAVAFLRGRTDVRDGRIGGIGLSVGGELMLESAAGNPALKAVVSEGAGARSIREELDSMHGLEKVLGGTQFAVRDAALSVFSGSTPPRHLKTLVPRIAPRPLMLIQAPNSPNGERLNDDYYRAAREPKTSWAIPESRHTGGIEARPREYERRVVGFFDAALTR
jgi:fermentation-respiration switch protein FrsA (DUF1100 family)